MKIIVLILIIFIVLYLFRLFQIKSRSPNQQNKKETIVDLEKDPKTDEYKPKE